MFKRVVLFFSLLYLSACGINNIPTYDEATTAAWSEVLNQYKRRADLIPNLVKTVQASADYERGVLNEIVEARSKATQTQLPPEMLNDPQAFQKFQAAQDGLSSALSRLLVVVENYPDLKANQNFLQLQSQIEGSDNRITVARRDYINSVKQLNTELRTYPGKLWHSFLHSDVQAKQQFTVEAEAMEVPDIQFN